MPTPGYQYLTLAAARSILAQRLQDTGIVQYSAGNGVGNPAALNRYIVEAVRAWQAYTLSYRQRATFNSAANTAFYDLTTVLSPACMQHTVTDAQIVSLVLAMLLEPPLTQTWTGSGMFQFSAIMNAIQARLNRFQGDTGIGTTTLTQAAGTGPPVDRVFLPDSVLDIRRAAWIDGAGKPTVLWRDDQFSMQAFSFGGASTPVDPPQVYGVSTLPPVAVQVYPPPANPGQVEIVYVPVGVQVGTTPNAVASTPVTINLADDLTWAVAFGAMADLLGNDSPARDPARAQYCEQRYEEAVMLARLFPSVMLAQVNGRPVWSGSLFELDAFQTTWESTPGTPTFFALAGRSLGVLGPIPDGVYGISLDVIPSIPVPSLDTDFLQVDRGNLDPVVDYAQHLASFQLGGAEFSSTAPLLKNFMTAAALENSRLRAEGVYESALRQVALMQKGEVVRV